MQEFNEVGILTRPRNCYYPQHVIIVIVMWGGKCARQVRSYGTIGVVGLGSRVG